MCRRAPSRAARAAVAALVLAVALLAGLTPGGAAADPIVTPGDVELSAVCSLGTAPDIASPGRLRGKFVLTIRGVAAASDGAVLAGYGQAQKGGLVAVTRPLHLEPGQEIEVKVMFRGIHPDQVFHVAVAIDTTDDLGPFDRLDFAGVAAVPPCRVGLT